MAPQEAYERYMQGLCDLAAILDAGGGEGPILERLREAWPKMSDYDRRNVHRASGDLEALTGEVNVPEVVPHVELDEDEIRRRKADYQRIWRRDRKPARRAA